METFLTIAGCVLILTIVLNVAKFLFGLIFKTVIGSVVGISAVLYGIFLLIK